MQSELPAERLRRSCDPQVLACDTSQEMRPLEAIIGQERALRALQFGLAIQEHGFNIYVAGYPGTGRTTTVERFLEQVARGKAVPDDWCYVARFDDPYRPRALRLPAGQGRELQAAIRRLLEQVRQEIPRAFEGEAYAGRRDGTVRRFQAQRDELIARLNASAQEKGFVIQTTQEGFLTIPLKDGKPYTEEEFGALPAEQQQEITKRREEVQEQLRVTLRQLRALDKSAGEALQELDRQEARRTLDQLLEEPRERFAGLAEVLSYLDEMQEDIVRNLGQFRGSPQEQPPALSMLGGPNLAMRKYEVNVLVDNSGLRGAPVVSEPNPTYNGLFGRMEKESQFGALYTDYTLIRQGSLHRANGGYLVLPVEELLRNLFSWDSLKRALRNRQIAIEEAGERLGYMTTKSLQPDPIPLEVKIVLIGSPALYQLLQSADEDFTELFRVKAEFDTRMDRTVENIQHYACFAAAICQEKGMKHMDRSGLLRLVEYGSRLADDQGKLSTRFGELTGVIREAIFYAVQDDAPFVSAAHVRKAIEEKVYRSNLIHERVRELIAQGTILIDVAGQKVGQVNGLRVVGLGDVSFGQPSRITASIGLGREGIVDIEREARLGGPIHSKGVMILSGYLAGKYAHDKPLSLSARLVFEQSYSGVEGDSASSAELYALLSNLADLPVQQGIAVTGSVNQKGQVQAIGGVNEKIEGFFEVCQALGLTGTQGVIIPASNARHLMLKEEVVEAVAAGQFHIWTVETIDDGMTILTGVEAGERRADGTYKRGTINYRVDRRLRQMAEELSRFGRPEGDKGKPGAAADEANLQDHQETI